MIDETLRHYAARALDAMHAWEARMPAAERHPALVVDPVRLDAALDAYTARLAGNYPFFHPQYAGQMLKPPHPAAIVGYLAAMCINPNNHALDGGPPTSAMEKEVVDGLRGLFGFPADALGHLTSGGTIANLEALWVARELAPEAPVVYSREAHYTHGRMLGVLRHPGQALPVDARGRLDLDAVEEALAAGARTVVATAGTTGIGAVDPIADLIPLARRYGARVHIDAAYGGFFRLLADTDDAPLDPETRRHLRAIAEADSVVVDPHKHGLQPYGCGAVLFRDPSVGRFYRHDSPYTYFTSDDLHLGEISLECSRAGAAAGALWLTREVLPWRADAGLGPVLAACLRAARAWQRRLASVDELTALTDPELDIVVYAPAAPSLSALDAASGRVFDALMADASPVFLSLLRWDAERLAPRLPGSVVDAPRARVLRSVLMKPEHEMFVDRLVEHVRTAVVR